MKAKVGSWIIITGHRQIQESIWRKTYPNGLFGRVIKINKRFSPSTGDSLPDSVIVRTYPKRKRYHAKSVYKYLKVVDIR